MADHEGSSVADSAKKGKTPRKTPGPARRVGDVEGQLKRLEDKISRRDSKVELLKSQLVQVKKREVMLVQEVQRTRELAAESAAQTSNQFMKMKTSLAATHERERMLREQLDTLRSQAPSTCASSIAPSPDRLGFSPFAPPQTDQKVKKLEEQLAEEKYRREVAEQKLAERPEPAPIPSAPSAPTPPTKDEFLARIKDAVSETVFPVVETHTADPVDLEALVVSLAALLDRSSNASLPYPQRNHNNTTIVDNTELPEDKACPVPDVTPPTLPEQAPGAQMTPPVQAADSELYNEEPALPAQGVTQQPAQPEEEDGWGADDLDLGDEQPDETQEQPVETQGSQEQPVEVSEHTEVREPEHEQTEVVEQAADQVQERVAVQELEPGLEGETDPEGAPLGEYQEEVPAVDYTPYQHGDWVRLYDYNLDPPHPYFMNLVTQEASWEQPPEFDWSLVAVYEVPQVDAHVEHHVAEQEAHVAEQGEAVEGHVAEQEAAEGHAGQGDTVEGHAEQGEGEAAVQGYEMPEGEEEPVIIGKTGEEVEETVAEPVQEEPEVVREEVEPVAETQVEELEVAERAREEETEKEQDSRPGQAEEPKEAALLQEDEALYEDVPEPQPVPQSPEHAQAGEEDLWPVDSARLSAVREEIQRLLPGEVTVEEFLGSYKAQYERQLLQLQAQERETENEKPPREQSVENSNIPTFKQDFLSGNSKEMSLGFTFET